jgi:ATP-dependent DNA helicase RecQ
VLKVLSGVARAKGRFGKNVVAQMLKGSSSEKMDRWGLKKLSTFGILPDFTQPELTRLLDSLAEAGYVECPEVDRFRPVVNLTEAGWNLLKSPTARPIELALPADVAAKVRFGGLERIAPRPQAPVSSPGRTLAEPEQDDSSETALEVAGDPLFGALKALRTEWARDAKQPAYCIFTNQTLELLVRARPTSPASLAAIKGFGPARLERYGAAVLEAIAAHSSRHGVEAGPTPVSETPLFSSPTRAVETIPAPRLTPKPAPLPAPAPVPTPNRSSYVPTEEWTWRLLDRGFSIDEAAAIRGLETTAILRHATLVARQGKPVRPELFLEAELLRRWEAWRAEQGDAAPPPDHDGPPELWSLFIACSRGR